MLTAVGERDAGVPGVSFIARPLRSLQDVVLPAPEDVDLSPDVPLTSVGLSPRELLLPAAQQLAGESAPIHGPLEAITNADGVAIVELPAEWLDAVGFDVEAKHAALHVLHANRQAAVVVEAEGFVPVTIGADVLWREPSLQIEMDAGIEWRLRLRDPEGAAVAGCTCLVMSESSLVPKWFPGMLPNPSANRCGMVGQTRVTDANGEAVFSGWRASSPVRLQPGDTNALLEVEAREGVEVIDLFRVGGEWARGARFRPEVDRVLELVVHRTPRATVVVEGGFTGGAKVAVFGFAWTDRFVPVEAVRDERPDRSFRVQHVVPKNGRSFELRHLSSGKWRSLGVFEYVPALHVRGIVVGDD